MTASPVTIDFLDPAYRADPYPQLAALRQVAPVYQAPLGFWLITRYDDVNALNRDPRLGRDLRRWHAYERVRPYLADSPLEKCVEQWMFSLDPPEHTRLRRLFARAFTPRIVNGMRERITAIALELLGGLDAAGEFDFMARFAQPFPVRVITELLDLPQGAYSQLKAWSDALVPVVEPMTRKKTRLKASQAAAAMSKYLQAHLRRYNQVGTFLGQLMGAACDETLNQDELVANLVFLFIAGHETTTNLLGNGLLALLRHPDQLAKLRREPDLVSSAVEELLRYDGPANVNARVTHEEIQIGDQTIPVASLVFCMLGAANRDPARFAGPDRLDISRDPNPHVTFGGGPHYCLGAPLARLEAQIALNCILQKWADIQVDESQIAWRDFINIRGLTRLPVSV